MKDEFGDRIKAYEKETTGIRLDVSAPIYARIDGRTFSTWTRGLDRPYDSKMSQLMIDTTAYLVEKSGATVGYTQSDEISLGWRATKDGGSLFFDGKLLKMTSVLAGMASAFFSVGAAKHWPDKPLPGFDCRVFNVPDEAELCNTFLWREQDARKNAISMLAHTYFSPKQLHSVSTDEKIVMLSKIGVCPLDYPPHFRKGTYLKRVVEQRELTSAELEAIPEKHRPKQGELVTRSRVDEMGWRLSHRSFDEKMGLLFGK